MKPVVLTLGTWLAGFAPGFFLSPFHPPLTTQSPCIGCIGEASQLNHGGTGGCSASLTFTVSVSAGFCEGIHPECVEEDACDISFSLEWFSTCSGTIKFSSGGVTVSAPVEANEPDSTGGSLEDALSCGAGPVTATATLTDSMLSSKTSAASCTSCPSGV